MLLALDCRILILIQLHGLAHFVAVGIVFLPEYVHIVAGARSDDHFGVTKRPQGFLDDEGLGRLDLFNEFGPNIEGMPVRTRHTVDDGIDGAAAHIRI